MCCILLLHQGGREGGREGGGREGGRELGKEEARQGEGRTGKRARDMGPFKC